MTAEKLRQGAIEEIGGGTAKPERGKNDNEPSWKTNAARNAWRTLGRAGLGWRVQISEFDYETGEGEVLTIPYIKPKSYLEFLMSQLPGVVVGGAGSIPECAALLNAFWNGYQQQHGSHEIFTAVEIDKSYTLPLLVHADEGRGKRRTNTLVISLETPLGLPVFEKKKRKRCDCDPAPHHLNKYPGDLKSLGSPAAEELIRGMATNTKGHSFLQRWPLVILPGVLYKAYPGIVDEFHELLGKELRSLYHEGFTASNCHFNGALVGVKADMKYHTKLGRLRRSYENKGTVQDKECCHWCLGGSTNLPWEDLQEFPCWEPSNFAQRPWNANAPPPLLIVPCDSSRPEALYQIDPFHTGKVGILRDAVGSSLFWLIEHNYFGAQGDLPSKLSSAYTVLSSCTALQRNKLRLYGASLKPCFSTRVGRASHGPTLKAPIQ